MKYTDLIFDLYGTLVDIKTEEDNETWQKTAMYFSFHNAPYTPDELKTAFYNELAKLNARAGASYECFPDISFEDVFSALFSSKGVKRNKTLAFNAAQLFRISSIKKLQTYYWVHNALDKLKEKGYRLWLLSNAQRAFTQYELNYLSLTDKFDGIYLSSDYNTRKPDQRFFKTLIENENLDPARCLMIGNDRETDIKGAQSVGLSTLFIQSNLTPKSQENASLSLSPENAPAGTRHFEYSGTMDWGHIAYLIYHFIDK